MNIEQYRSSFNVCVIDKQLERCDSVFVALKDAGYSTSTSLSSEQFFERIKLDPPHIIFVEQDTLIVLGEEFVESCLRILPEVHMIVYAEQTEIFSASHFFDQGAYDCVAYIDNDFEFLVRAADRAAERDYYMYMNEQLMSKNKRDSVSLDKAAFMSFEMWVSQLMETRNLKEAIDLYLQEVSRFLGEKQIVFFKYIPSHQSLVASQSVVADVNKVRGLGFELSKEEENFSLDQLHKPMTLEGLRRLMSSSLGIDEYFAQALVVQGVPEGVFVFVGSENIQAEPYIKSCVKSLGLKISQLNLSKKLHAVSIHDDKTRVLNKQNFLEDLKKEVSRSRRITLPITLLILSIDGFADFEKRLSRYEVDLMLKMCATILKRHSRVNDIVGRIGESEFGIILPHTGKLGGAIKGERLRRIFESADFSKVVPGNKQITISVGVSEYPSHCRDYEDILQTAFEALNDIRTTGSNKVCLASAPERFIPDFLLDGTKL